MMLAVNELFSDEIKEMLKLKVGAYPLYIYFINYLLYTGLYRNLEDRSLFKISGNSKSVKGRLAFYYIKKLLKSRLYIRGLFKGKPPVKEVDILLLSRYRPIDTNGVKGLKTDYLFNTIISEIHENPLKLRMALVSLDFPGECYTDDRVDNFNLSDFYSLKILLKSLVSSFFVYLRYRKTAKSLSSTVKRVFDEFFDFRRLLWCHLFDLSFSEAIKSLNPKVIVSNDDVQRFKPLSYGSKLIVLQSALVTEQLEKYRNLLFSSFLEDKLLSDCFCVSGPRIKSLKEKFLKDTKKVVVTGQPRFDNLAKANELFDKNKICKKFGLAPDRRTLLWATETHSLPDKENKKNISAVYYATNLLGNLQLVIKLHPDEDQEAPLYRQNCSYCPLVVGGSENLSELLLICDAFLTKSSTAAFEAAILKKPIVILNLSGEPDIMPYVESGMALGVYKGEDLVSAIEDALYNKRVREKLAKAQERFAYDYAYIQDGKASERVANLIIQMIEESRKTKN